MALYTKAETAVSGEATFEGTDKDRAKAVQQSCSLNLAAVCLKLGRNKEAANHAGKVLAQSPAHVKALYRRCQAYTALGDFIEAESDIRSALLADPDSRDLQLAQRDLKRKMKADSKRSSKLYGAMFSKVGDLYDAPPPPPPPPSGAVDGALQEVEMDAPDMPLEDAAGDDGDVTEVTLVPGPVTDAAP